MNTQPQEIKFNHLSADDLFCTRCGVQPTLNADHICGWCNAIGKLAEPEPQPGLRSEIMLDIDWAMRTLFGLRA